MLRGDQERLAAERALDVPSVYSRTLRRAAQIVGGADKLAEQLGVTPTNLALWIHGTGVPPSDIFLQAVDLVTAHGVSELLPKKDQPPPG